MAWLADEPGGRAQVGELTRVLRRAGRRPALTAAVALVLGALLLHWQLRRPAMHALRAELVLTESSLSSDRSRLSRSELRVFVESVAFSSRHLLPIIERHDLYRSERRRGTSLALAEMRRYIEVDVYQDYFAEDRYQRSPVRSARIAVTFRHDEAEVGVAVVRELGELVARAELARHGERARRRAELARGLAEGAARDARAAHQGIAAIQAAAAKRRSLTPDEIVRLRRLRALLADAERRAEETERELADAQLALAAEEKEAGTRVHVAGLHGSRSLFVSDGERLARQATAAAGVGLALALLIVGAFNPRLHDLDDVRRAGGEPLGRIDSLGRNRA